MNELKWAVLGTGVIANEMAQALQNMGRTLYGVCNRTYDKAVSFAEKYHIKKVYTSYDEMYADPSIDVIYITTPHNTHYEFIRQSLLHGKHVLAEKSITLNSSEKAYIEIMEYPRADHAVIVDAETGNQTIIEAGRTSDALQYELEDMETAILTGNTAIMKLRESSDVMDIMTKLRSDWELFYPEEIHS